MSKRFFYVLGICLLAGLLSGCTSNPATGQKQFTALMSPSQEVKVGAQEHAKIMKQYGVYKDVKLQNYVSDIGKKISANTERSDVNYKFYLLDSPMVNAFALPGGYVYLTRGLLALSNSEAEMASVLAHEVGHITARHSAERYSRGVVTSLGAAILSTAIGSDGAAQALGVGSDLYIKSYSRGQESQSDSLGIRYLARAGYNPSAMSGFLINLQNDTALEAKMAGKNASNNTNYFATHPATAERVNKTINEARGFAQQGIIERDKYLQMLDGMVYGDSASQGFVRGNDFYHTEIGFKFSVPEGYKIANQPSKVIAKAKNGSAIIFDLLDNKDGLSPSALLSDVLSKVQGVSSIDDITVNGMAGATASFSGAVSGKQMQIRVVVIRWSNSKVARFQVAVSQGLSSSQLDAIKSSTYSFARMSDSEKRSIRPYRVKVTVSKAGDSVASMSQRMAQSDYKQERFRVLNGLKPHDRLFANRLYKIVVK